MSIIAKYKFDKNIYENLIPVFNDGYSGYTISDEIDSVHSNHVIRTIECDTAPTYIRFGLTETESSNNIRTSEADALREIISLDISGLNSLRFMFRYCKNLTSINTSGWDTSGINDLYSTFQYCHSLTSLDVSNWDVSNITIMATTFGTTPNLTSLIGIENWDTRNVTTIAYMFCGCGLTSLDLSGWNTESLTNMGYTFWSTPLQTLNLSGWNTSKVTSMYRTFKDSSQLTSLDISNWDVSNVTDMFEMFSGCSQLTSLDVSKWNTSKVTNMACMFHECIRLTSLDVSKWDTRNVTDMAYMFYRCYSLTSLDVSNWDTSKVEYMNEMFESCSTLTSLDVSKWDTSNVTNMMYMFSCVSNVEKIDVSNWDTSKVKNMCWMFFHCLKLKALDLSNWDTSKVTNMTNLIVNCEALEQLSINSVLLDHSHVLSGTPSLKRVITDNIITINTLSNKLDSRTGKEPGCIVTSIRDQIDEETIELLSSKNWQIRDLVAQYRFDANTFENLMPEFNPEFTEDMYEVHDSVSEIVIDDFEFEYGAIAGDTGNNVSNIPGNNNPEACCRTIGYISILPNVEYKITATDGIYGGACVCWYDENKKFIIQKGEVYSSVVSPVNAKYMRFWSSSYNINKEFEFKAKLVTRSIESKNGDLPTLMRFGNKKDSGENLTTEKELSLLKVLDLNMRNVNNVQLMFHRCERVTSIKNMRVTDKCTSLYGTFSYCNKLTDIDVSNWDTSNIDGMSSAFHHCMSLTTIPGITNWDTSKLTTAGGMFRYCIALTSLDLSGWDTSKVTGMGNMFNDCQELNYMNLSNWNTSNVTDMNHMFYNCKLLNNTNFILNNITWDTSNVTDMAYMWAGCSSFEIINLGVYNTSKVTNISYMFYGCRSATKIQLTGWDTSNVTTMNSLFNGCDNLTTIEGISDFNTSNVTDMSYMFELCANLQSIDISKWNVSKVKTMYRMFNHCSKITDIKLPRVTNNTTILSWMFRNCYALPSLDISDWDTSNVTTTTFLFSGCNQLRSLDISNWDVHNVVSMEAMFNGCYNLTSLDLSKWRTDSLKSIIGTSTVDGSCIGMFHGCSKLTTIGNVSNWDTSKITNMQKMFYNCEALTSLDGINEWDVSNVSTMYAMFYKCNNLTSLDLSNWDTSQVTDMGGMFAYCRQLTSVDVSNFDTSNVTNMATPYGDDVGSTLREGMFCHCNNLTSIDVSNFDTSKVIEMGGMFWGCGLLTSLDLSNWDTSQVTTMTNMFDDCLNLTRIEGIENWNVGNVDNFNTVFNDCYNLRNLDLSRWNVKPEARLTGMFNSNNSAYVTMNIVYLDIRNWEIGEPNMHYTDRTTGELARSPIISDRNTQLKYIRNDVASTVDWLATNVLTRTTNDPGYIITEATISNETIEALAAKNWNVVRFADMNPVDIAIYKFDKSIHKWMVPVFDNNFAGWFIDDVVEDEVNTPNIVTRTIRSMGGLPTKMQFGKSGGCDRGYSLVDLIYANVNELTTMAEMFDNCANLYNCNTEGWNTGKVTNMGGAFAGCHSLSSLDVSNFDTSNVTLMNYIFNGCINLPLLDVSNWDTRNVISMYAMFQGCQSLTSLDVSNWDTGKVTNMSYVFNGCKSLISLDVSNWDVSNVFSMYSMFMGCWRLASLNVSNWDVGKVVDMVNMFYGCHELQEINVANWDMRNVTNIGIMFADCIRLTTLPVDNWDVSKIQGMRHTFKNCESLTSLNVSSWTTTSLTDTHETFVGCNKLTSLDVSNWNTSKVTNMSYMFCDCNNLTSLDVSNFDTRNVTSMSYMFAGCNNLTSIGDISNWNTGKLYDMLGMFQNCQSLISLDINNWNTNNVATMESLFNGCSSLESIDLSGWNTTRSINMGWLFNQCNSLKMIDISNFNIKDGCSTWLLYGHSSSADVGMIYCDFKTIEKVAAVVPTTNPTTIWVGNHIDINGLPQYDHITYKVYEVEDKLEVELSSPVLEGDRLEIIDGDLYHYHNAGIMNLRGYENWYQGNSDSGWTYQDGCALPFHTYIYKDNVGVSENEIMFYKAVTGEMTDQSVFDFMKSNNLNFVFDNVKENLYTDNISLSRKTASNNYVSIRKNGVENVEEFKSWLRSNPVTLLYKLANPYYELVKPNVGLLNAEQGLYLNISDSVVPVVNHQDLCTLKLNYLLPNVEYKVKFKANNAGSIAINLGGTLVPLDIVEGWNEVMVTTPETLVDAYLKVNGSEGIKIQNVMVIDSNKDFDYFKGMNNTFDEIPVKNICPVRTNSYIIGTNENGEAPKITLNKTISKGKVVTVVGKVENNVNNKPIAINLYKSARNKAYGKNKWIFGDFKNVNTTKQLRASELGVDYLIPPGEYYLTFVATQYPVSDDLPKMIVPSSEFADNHRQIYPINLTDGATRTRNRVKTENGITAITFYTNGYNYNGSVGVTADYEEIQLEEMSFTGYEPPEFHVNNEPVIINNDNTVVDEAVVDISIIDGEYFAITIKADRDYADQIAIYIPDEDGCETGEIISVTDLMVFEGDILDCHPTTYVDPADTRYLVEYKSIGNPFGFGKNKLI